MALGKTARYYNANPKAKAKKARTDKKINARTEQKSKRAELGRIRTADEKKGKNIKGKDYDHATCRYETPKVNRGRKGEGGRKKTKR
jgi:hypothetical protein